MKIEIPEIRQGKWNNKEIWVCDFPSDDRLPILHPQKAMVLSNKLKPTNKTPEHLSKSHVRRLYPNGKVSPEVISAGHPAVPIYAFTTKEECVERFQEFIFQARQRLLRDIDALQKRHDELITLSNNL
jgi:hypothetical protein